MKNDARSTRCRDVTWEPVPCSTCIPAMIGVCKRVVTPFPKGLCETPLTGKQLLQLQLGGLVSTPQITQEQGIACDACHFFWLLLVGRLRWDMRVSKVE
jgi:hypothetical protein